MRDDIWIALCHAERGRGHIRQGTPCQDKTFSLCENGVHAIALADGAGSARLSHFGAEKATERICRFLVERFEDFFNGREEEVRDAIRTYLYDALDALCAQLDCSPKDLACTLLTVAVKDDRYVLMHCGDGVTGYMRNDELGVATKPMNGEYANETVFITSAGMQYLRIEQGALNGIRGFALMSDGAGACLYSNRGEYLAPFVAKIINWATYLPPRSVEEILLQAFQDTIVQKTTDDCSLAFLIKRDADTSKYPEQTFEAKCELLGINGTALDAGYLLMKREAFLRLLQCPKTQAEIAEESGIRTSRYLAQKLCRLIESGLVEKQQDRYLSTVVL